MNSSGKSSDSNLPCHRQLVCSTPLCHAFAAEPRRWALAETLSEVAISLQPDSAYKLLRREQLAVFLRAVVSSTQS